MYSIRYYLSDRFRLRFEDSGIDEMMDESELQDGVQLPNKDTSDLLDEGIDMHSGSTPTHNSSESMTPEVQNLMEGGVIRTLDGEIAGDEFAQDAINYQILLGKIDKLLDNLKLDA